MTNEALKALEDAENILHNFPNELPLDGEMLLWHIQAAKAALEAKSVDVEALKRDVQDAYVKHSCGNVSLEDHEGVSFAVDLLAAQGHLSTPVKQKGIDLAVIGRDHFGNPIPQEWYSAAKELLAYHALPKAQSGWNSNMDEDSVAVAESYEGYDFSKNRWSKHQIPPEKCGE